MITAFRCLCPVVDELGIPGFSRGELSSLILHRYGFIFYLLLLILELGISCVKSMRYLWCYGLCLGGVQHGVVGNAFFQILLAKGDKAEAGVERFEVGLGADADGLSGVETGAVVDGDLHNAFAKTYAPVCVCGDDSANGGFGVFFAGVEDAQVGGELAFVPNGYMPSVQIVEVGVGAADALLVDENGLSRQHNGVELEGRQGFEAVAVEFYIISCVHGIRFSCAEIASPFISFYIAIICIVN